MHADHTGFCQVLQTYLDMSFLANNFADFPDVGQLKENKDFL